MSSAGLLTIPGDVNAVWAQHERLVKIFRRLQDCAHCVKSVRLDQWTGLAADHSTELRFSLAGKIWRTADAAEDAAHAIARYAITLAEVQSRRRLLALAVDDNAVTVAVANEDIARWRDQAQVESSESSVKIDAAKRELSTVSSVFKGVWTPDRQTPPHVPGLGASRPHHTTVHRKADSKDSSPYAAEKDPSIYNERMVELMTAVTDGSDMILPNRGVPTWEQWQEDEGREIGRISL